jgi:tetratricopeptide (TPR) repeat protein
LSCLKVSVLLLFAFSAALGQDSSTAQQLFTQQRWSELVQLIRSLPRARRTTELNYEYGIALAQLGRWEEAHAAFLAGQRVASSDKRFPIELAGVAFKQKKNGEAIGYLRRALQLDATDAYSNDFLATLYFLQGNTEAALKYWNRTGKPDIENVDSRPEPRLRPVLLDHAFAFSPADVMRLDEFRTTDARLANLEVFPSYRIDLVAGKSGKFDAEFRAVERNGFGSSLLEALLGTFRGLPFQEVDPEYYNIAGKAINVVSLMRWDPDKRRAFVAISGPLFSAPEWRYRIGVDLRNENWDIRNGFTGPAPVLAAFNLRREAVNGEIERSVGWRWRWALGVELSHRDERNVTFGILSPELLAAGYQLEQNAILGYEILRSPEHRLAINSKIDASAARMWSTPEQSYARVRPSIKLRWLPQAKGDDYEMNLRVGGGKTLGQVPFDELWMLGLERDNDLPLRAHIGTRDGRKGSAPLGRDYFLENWEADKNLYSNGLITLRLGPFLDTGRLANALNTPDAQKWLFDTGAQLKVRVLGVGATFVYGKDLRTGNNAFYATVNR